MKKIIITGGSGFLGTQITKQLLALGEYKIVIVDIVPPRVQDTQVSFFKKNLLEPFNASEEYEVLKNPYTVEILVSPLNFLQYQTFLF